MIDNGSLQAGSSAYTVTTGLVGGLTGSMINNSLEGNLGLSSGVQSTTLFSDPYEFTYLSRKKEGSVDPSLPANPDDLLKRPGWKETTHPEASKKGHRTFENKNTGEKLRHDKGKPWETGHKGHDHYHRPNPDRTAKHDEYLDGQGNPTSDQSDSSHIYSPEGVWWNS